MQFAFNGLHFFYPIACNQHCFQVIHFKQQVEKTTVKFQGNLFMFKIIFQIYSLKLHFFYLSKAFFH